MHFMVLDRLQVTDASSANAVALFNAILRCQKDLILLISEQMEKSTDQ